MIPPYRAQTTVKAIETTNVLTFNGKDLIDLCEANPKIGCKVQRALAVMIAARLEDAFIQLMGVTSRMFSNRQVIL